MKAVRFHQYGGPEVLKIEEVNIPEPGPGQIIIAVKAAGVNKIDGTLRAGYLHDFMPVSFPAGVGLDASGIVTAIGERVTGVAIGDAVFGKGENTVAEYAILHEWAHKPDSISFGEAAGYPIPVETAFRIIDEVGIRKGETLLVSGASGGVGSAVIQFARAAGINTIGTASESRHDYLLSIGAIPTTYGPGLSARVAALAPDGVQAALDIAGSGIIPELIQITGDPNKVLTIVDVSAHEFGIKTSFEPRNLTPAMEAAMGLFNEGRFSLPVARVFSMDQVGLAQELSTKAEGQGRLIIKID